MQAVSTRGICGFGSQLRKWLSKHLYKISSNSDLGKTMCPTMNPPKSQINHLWYYSYASQVLHFTTNIDIWIESRMQSET